MRVGKLPESVKSQAHDASFKLLAVKAHVMTVYESFTHGSERKLWMNSCSGDITQPSLQKTCRYFEKLSALLNISDRVFISMIKNWEGTEINIQYLGNYLNVCNLPNFYLDFFFKFNLNALVK